MVGSSADPLSLLSCSSMICACSSSVQLLVTTCSQESPSLTISLKDGGGIVIAAQIYALISYLKQNFEGGCSAKGLVSHLYLLGKSNRARGSSLENSMPCV